MRFHRARRRCGRVMALGVALPALLSACIGGGTLPAAQVSTRGAPSSNAAAAPHRWTQIWHVAQRPLTDVYLVDGMVIVGYRKGLTPYLEGIDETTGRVAWSHPLSGGNVKVFVYFEPVPLGSNVGYLAPASGGRSRVTIVSARSGATLAASPPVTTYSPAYACGDSTNDLCVSLEPLPARRYRLGVGDLELRADPSGPVNALPFPNANLMLLDATSLEKLGSTRNGRLVWTRTFAAIFGSSVVASSGYLDTELATAAGRLYATYQNTSYQDAAAHGRPASLDAMWTTATVRLSDGKVLWRAAKWDAGCAAPLGAVYFSRPAAGIAVECHYTGTVQAGANGNDRYRLTSATVRGVDPNTGTTTWLRRVPNPAALAPDAARTAVGILDARHVLIRGPHAVVLDISTGAMRPATAADRAWCVDLVGVPYRIPGLAGQHTMSVTSGWEPCSAGATSRVAMPANIPPQVGDSLNGMQIVLRASGVAAYR